MFNFIINKLIGTYNERQIKRAMRVVEKINKLEPEISKLSDAELKAKTEEFRRRIDDYLKKHLPDSYDDDLRFKLEQKALNEILPEAFAVVREVAKRLLNMRHFDVQLIGGLVLHEGKIAEMATGEGKTLVATLPAYLNALTGRGVHIVTVNDYLARRDREWMGPIYEFLGLTVGVLQHDMPPWDRKKVYACDIVYGTNNEFGFDYLRDNMVVHKEDMVQRELHYAIVDEVDSILIDEARTPLIISGPAEESTELYYKIDKIIPLLQQGQRDEETKEETGDFIVDEKAKTAYLTEKGEEKVAKLLGVDNLHDIDTMELKHHVNQALKAHHLFKKDVDYVVKDGKVIIVDEFTGRLMPGRRWSDGLHQAIEAKEGVKIERENQTLATITLQNYFRMYRKLAGMTGTAATEAAEFRKIYGLDVVVIPTNKPLRRINYPDVVFRTQKEKFDAVVEEIEELYKKGRPVLVGTTSIEKSEYLSNLLKLRGIPHQVLNAKYHEREAHIVAQAGRYKAVTIATNMAGRGTDILLGGNPEFLLKSYMAGVEEQDPEKRKQIEEQMREKLYKQAEEEHKKVVELGGLHVIGTERHESRRIDNQLRGRAGRQGDPGSSRFYVALDDDLMRLFGSDRISAIMQRLGMEEGERLEHPLISKSIEMAQKRVETHHFEIRKNLLELDDVMNRQREVIYGWRKEVLFADTDKVKEMILDVAWEVLENAVNTFLPAGINPKDWEFDEFLSFLKQVFALTVEEKDLVGKDREEVLNYVFDLIEQALHNKMAQVPDPESFAEFMKMVFLQVIDKHWKEHLHAMDILKESIDLRAYGNMDPIVEYKQEAFNMFSILMDSIKNELVMFIFNVRIDVNRKMSGVFASVPKRMVHPSQDSLGRASSNGEAGPKYIPKPGEKIPRNAPCPCGSGKKYKKCCGRFV